MRESEGSLISHDVLRGVVGCVVVEKNAFSFVGLDVFTRLMHRYHFSYTSGVLGYTRAGRRTIT
jgi:hypothetical protein